MSTLIGPRVIRLDTLAAEPVEWLWPGRIRNGRKVPVNNNAGLRKLCQCPRRIWPRCPHAWHFSCGWKGRSYRFSLDRYAGKHIASKTEADLLADDVRAAIRKGSFCVARQEPTLEPLPPDKPRPSPLFETAGAMFIDSYSKAREKVSWRDDASMITRLMSFTPPWSGAVRLVKKPVSAVTEQDLEAFIRHLGALGRTAATKNHYVRILRVMDRWLVRKEYRPAPLLSGESDVIRKRRATKRSRRLAPTKK